MKRVDVSKHVLISKHVVLSQREKADLLRKYNITVSSLPRILKDDPAIAKLSAKEEDVVKILRNSATAGEAVFYRVVMSG